MDSVLHKRSHKSTGDILELWNFLSSSRKKQVWSASKELGHNGVHEQEEEAERCRPLLVLQHHTQEARKMEKKLAEEWASCMLHCGSREEAPGKLFKDDGEGKWLEGRQAFKRSLGSSLEEPSASPKERTGEKEKEEKWNWSEPPIMATEASGCCIRPHQSGTGSRGAGGRCRARRRKVLHSAAIRKRLASSTPALTQAIISTRPTPEWLERQGQVNGDTGQGCERIEALRQRQQRLSDARDTHSQTPTSNRSSDSSSVAKLLEPSHTVVDLEGLSCSVAVVDRLSLMAERVAHEATGSRCRPPSKVVANSDCHNANSAELAIHSKLAEAKCFQTSQRPLAASTLGLHHESPLTNDNGSDFEQLQVEKQQRQVAATDHRTEQAPDAATPTPASLSSTSLQSLNAPSNLDAITTTTTATATATATTTQHPQQHTFNYASAHQRVSRAHTRSLRLSIEREANQQQLNDYRKNGHKLSDQSPLEQVNSNQQMGPESSSTDKGGEFILRSIQSNSWLQALQLRHSGSYQVVQAARNQLRAESAISGAVEQQKQEVEVAPSANTRSKATGGKQVVHRISRPGRSPVSLQRQTNARLARHMYKLQLQREQPQELNSSAQCHSRDQQVQISKSQPAAGCSYESRHKLQPPYPLPDRLSFTYSKSARLGRGNRSVKVYENSSSSTVRKNNIIQDLKNSRLERHSNKPSTKNQKHQVIQLQATGNCNATTRAIEICDNQLACSSRQQTHQTAFFLPSSSFTRNCYQHQPFHQVTNSNQREPANHQRQVNVVVYKSINMLRNMSQDCVNSSREVIMKGKELEDSGSINSASGSSTLSLNKPFCKICHMSSAKNGDKLISPCKCSGTMQYIHCGCLLKWLEISNRTNEKPICCELCSHEYSWHKKFNYKRMRFPSCSLKDIFLHMFFFFAIGMMLGCVISPILQRRSAGSDLTKLPSGVQQETTSGPQLSDSLGSAQTEPGLDKTQGGRGKKPYHAMYNPHLHHSGFGTRPGHLASGHLAQEEKLMLICAAVFFISFFIAVYSQTIARDSVYGLFVKFLNMNRTYYITEYNHGQLNNNTCSGNKQQLQQQQQQLTDGRSWIDRKSSPEEQ